jgi:hypothetical protein
MLDLCSSLVILWYYILNTQLEPPSVSDLLDNDNIAEFFGVQGLGGKLHDLDEGKSFSAFILSQESPPSFEI